MKIMVQDRNVDRAFQEPLAIPLFTDQRPPRRSTGRVDWKLGGMLSRMLLEEIIEPGLPLLLERGQVKPFPEIMLLCAGEYKNISDQGAVRWIQWALSTMALAGARFFTIAVWDLFDEQSTIQDFAARVLKGIRGGLSGLAHKRVNAVRLVWEPGTAELFIQELRRGMHRYPEMEEWEIGREELKASRLRGP
jgi:hypothetical protein